MGTEVSAKSNRLIPKLTERGQKLMWLILRSGISRALGLTQQSYIDRNSNKNPKKRLDNE